jgi:hypothetical protein
VIKDDSDQKDIDQVKVSIQTMNQCPKKPQINGPIWIKTGVNYEYIIETTDPEKNDVYYYINWGDSSNISWEGPYISGEKVTISHKWNNKNIHSIYVRAKDIFGDESEETMLRIFLHRSFLIPSYLLELLQNFPRLYGFLKL